ncbi:Predicted sugar kinase [Moraxella ovis]|nr:Predicted sugar kinase [Moraxella ovis]
MLGDIDDADALDSLAKMDAVCFGMGLGRDGWAKQTFKRIFDHLLVNMANKAVILDADALWHLATYPMQCKLPKNGY